MKNVSIYEKKWIDLVFEGKNKEYGAYQLRQENPRTTLMALFSGLAFISTIVAVFVIQGKFSTPDIIPSTPTIDDPIVITSIDLEPDVVLPEVKPQQEVAAQQDVTPTNLTNMVVAPTEVSVNVPTNSQATYTPATTGEGNGTGIIPSNGGTTSVVINPPVDPGPMISALLDKQPTFPGGIEKFYQYVGNKFEKPETEFSKPVRIMVSFIIEKNGTLTDIKVVQNPGYGLDKEAIRVLKSLKTKWTPGIKNGNPVRTAYTLPIVIQPE